MHNKLAVFATILAALALAMPMLRAPRETAVPEAKKETAYERVMRTRTLRCGYSMYDPFLMLDPQTKAMKGIHHDVVEAIGRLANLKVEWTQEVGYGAFSESLRAGKIDMFCLSVWPSAARAQQVEMTAPVQFTPIYALARESDNRFNGKLDSLDNEGVTVAVIDGSAPKAIADADFPKAKQYALPMDSDMAQMFLATIDKKADVTFADVFGIRGYNQNNPNARLVQIPSTGPVRTYGEVFAVAKGEWELRDLISTAISELQNNGTIDRILTQYEPYPGAILRVARPYANPVTQ